MHPSVSRYIQEKEQDIIKSTQEFIRLKSVEEAPVGKNAPFGQGIANCLEWALALGESMGFTAKNLDGYAGVLDYGVGDETLGILCHIDVVPEGTGWTFDPYGGVISDGKIYGRGAQDDKGPTIASMYALWAIKEANIPLKKKIRIILGCDEESGWKCIEHYRTVEPMPDIAFSPDADYPVVYAEKGILHVTYQHSFPSNITLVAGTRPNVVPGEAELMVPLPLVAVEKAAKQVEAESGCRITLSAHGEKTKANITGMQAHASTPEQGNNALTAALLLLSRLSLGEDSALAERLVYLFHKKIHGEGFGICITDETGITTTNPGILHWDKDGIKTLCIDVRTPKALSIEHARELMDKGLQGFIRTSDYVQPMHMVPKDSELVTKLLKVYAEHAGEYLEPLAIGGGTYARALPTAVAFGCERPGETAPVHMPDEYIKIEDLLFHTRVIADAIVALAE